MMVTEKIYQVIKEKNYKQSAIAVAAGYNPKTFNNLLKGRKKFSANDVVPICKALGITPNGLFNYGDRPSEWQA